MAFKHQKATVHLATLVRIGARDYYAPGFFHTTIKQYVCRGVRQPVIIIMY